MIDHLSQKIIEKIKQDKITPRPRWRFLLMDSSWWLLFAISVIFGALVFSLLFNKVADNDWSAYSLIGATLVNKILFTLPYLWLILLVVLGLLAWRELKQTRGSYRRNLTLILAACLASSFFLGSLIYQMGASDELEELLSLVFPQYQAYQIHSSGLWDRPELGFLAGEIIAVADPDNFLLKDVNQKIWIIEGRQIVWTGSARPQVRSLVKVMGRVGTDQHFVAQSVRLWRP